MEKQNERITIMHVAQAAGGVARYIELFLKHIDHDNYKNILVCSKDFDKEIFSELADELEYVDMGREICMKDFKACREVRKLIKKHRPDIIYCHSSKAGGVARIAAMGTKAKVVYNAHGWAFNMRCSRKKRRTYLVMEWLLSKITHQIVCISEFEMKSALKKRICGQDKLHKIYNGIDVNEIENAVQSSPLTREGLGIPEDAFVVGMVGRIAEQKAPDVFLNMAVRVKKEIPNAFFVIVGDGPDRAKIEWEIGNNKLNDSFLITGWVNNVYEYLGLLDVGVLLSRWEGFGLAICEFMAAHKPVVCTIVDAIPELVEDHENGILVRRNDSRGAYKAVVELYRDKALRERLIRRGEGVASSKFDIKRVVYEHEVMFARLTGRSLVPMGHMNSIYALLFDLLQVSIGKKEALSRTPNQVEWNVIYELGIKHAIMGVLFYAVYQLPQSQLPPKRLLAKWYLLSRQMAAQNELLNKRVAFAVKTFAKEGFRTCLLKGQGMALQYPNPLSRQCGDIDIWVDGEMSKIVDYVHDILPDQEVRYHHVEFPILKDVNMEVHFRPSFLSAPWRNRQLQKFFRQEAEAQFANETLLSEEYGNIYVPTPRFNAIYQLVHIYRHLFDEGIGLRHLMDYYYVLTGLPQSEHSQVRHRIESLGMKRFARAVMYVLEVVFDLDRQYMLYAPDARTGKHLYGEIMLAGNFGQFDPRNGEVIGESALHHFVRKLRRNSRFLFAYPEEVMWEPLFRIYHWYWRATKGWK